MQVSIEATDLVDESLTANCVTPQEQPQRSEVYRQAGRRTRTSHCSEAALSFSGAVRQHPKRDRDAQLKFLVPFQRDVGVRDSRSLMDVALFRVSKGRKRAGGTIHYDLPNGYVEVKAGSDGMASIWDYDIVLMLVSYLTAAMNRYREGKARKPGRVLRPQVRDILMFCRKGDGSRQYVEIEAALDRLQGTVIKSVREVPRFDGRVLRTVESEGLISSYAVVSRTDTGKVASLEIEVPKWIYKEVTSGKRPEVLTVDPGYFMISTGIGRFVYRLARQAAGKEKARWSFQTIYERSGSESSLKEFSRILRKIILANDLPGYILHEEAGKSGPQLVMMSRKANSGPI